MNPIELVKGMPAFEWTDHCAEEIILTGEQLLEQSDFVWRIGHIALAGFMYNSFVNPPWMWFVLAKGTTISDLIDFRRLARGIPKGTLTAVAESFEVGMKFAKFYGFEETGETQIFFDRPFKLLRKG